jgi:ABC-type polysaccharide/polyol phosphate transport system ATPase subunit
MNDVSIECRNLVVAYDLHSHKVSTLKEFVIMKTKGRLSKATKTALKGVDFIARKGECVALVGHNGCGKSTLLKCIAGILLPNEGRVTTHGRIAPMIELGAGFDPEMTGRENVYLSCSLLGLVKSEIDAKIAEIEKFSELGEFFDTPVKTYSSGMYMRLGFACTTAIAADIVLIDEILAVGDENFQKKCISRINTIRDSGCTVILVSHDLTTVLNMADKVYIIDEGIVAFEGDPRLSIAHYYELMEKKRFAALSKEEQDEELRRIRLEQNAANTSHFGSKAKVVDAEVKVTTTQSGLTDIALTLHVRIFTPFSEDLIVGFALISSRGYRILGGNTRSLPASPPESLRKVGLYKITFEFSDMPLATGDFQFTAGIHNQSLDETIDIQGDLALFRINNPMDMTNFDSDILLPGALIKLAQIHTKKVAE